MFVYSFYYLLFLCILKSGAVFDLKKKNNQCNILDLMMISPADDENRDSKQTNKPVGHKVKKRNK